MAFNVTENFDTLSADSANTTMRVLHDEVARMTFPRMPNASFEHSVDFEQLLAQDQYDSTLRRNLLDAANGITSMLFPVGDQGFSLQPGRISRAQANQLGLDNPNALRELDSAKSWFMEATEELVYRLRGGSNFVNASGEAILEWWAFGTGGLRRDWDERRQRFNFRNMPVNTYALRQDSTGSISEVYTVLNYTARQAAQEWGRKALPEQVRDRLDDPTTDKVEQYVMGVREVMPFDKKEDRDAAKGRGWLMKVEYKQTKEEIVTDGFHDSPFSFGRFATITGLPYGFSPVWLIIPENRRLYRLQELADAQGLAALAPPIAALAKYKGRVNRGPLGVTYVDDMTEAPKMVTTSGPEYKIGLDRIESARDDIGAVLHMDFFRLFTGQEKPPETATVARLMDAERAGQVGTPYQRLTMEFFAPQVLGGFNTAYRQGLLPDPPEELILGIDEATGQPIVPEPEILFENRLVNALKAVENVAFSEWMSLVGGVIAEAAPEVFQSHMDMDALMRGSFRNAVKQEDYLRSEADANASQEAAAAAQEQQMMLEQAKTAAEAAAKVPA